MTKGEKQEDVTRLAGGACAAAVPGNGRLHCVRVAGHSGRHFTVTPVRGPHPFHEYTWANIGPVCNDEQSVDLIGDGECHVECPQHHDLCVLPGGHYVPHQCPHWQDVREQGGASTESHDGMANWYALPF